MLYHIFVNGYYQSFFDEIVDGEGDKDETGAEGKEVPAGDVLKQLHSPETGHAQNATRRREFKH